MKRSLSIAGSAFVVLLTLALPIFAQQAGYEPDTRYQDGGWWLPEAASDYSGRMDFKWRVIFVAVAFMFLLTEGLLIAFCVMYRRRPGHRPAYIHGNNKAELVWTVIPALMLLGIAVWQIPHWNMIKRDGFPDPKDPKVTVVDVMGEQFKWHFRLAGTKEAFKASSDFSNLSNMHVPFGNAVLCNLRAKDVIHSLYIPVMRVKQDTVPGLRQRAWFRPNRLLLIDLDPAKRFQDGLKKGDGTLRTVQPRTWIELDPADPDKAFKPGGAYYDKKVAVSGMTDYIQADGLYDVLKAGTVARKVKVLYQGQVQKEKMDWSQCQYAIGIHEIACAELCGMGHYTMRGQLLVEPRLSFESWLKDEMDDLGDPDKAWKFWVN